MNFNIKNKKICILGTAFKKDTNDPRESPAVKISHYLLEEGAKLQLYDPETKRENVRDLVISVYRGNEMAGTMEGGIFGLHDSKRESSGGSSGHLRHHSHD